MIQMFEERRLPQQYPPQGIAVSFDGELPIVRMVQNGYCSTVEKDHNNW